jgi:hypothetical protein
MSSVEMLQWYSRIQMQYKRLAAQRAWPQLRDLLRSLFPTVAWPAEAAP